MAAIMMVGWYAMLSSAFQATAPRAEDTTMVQARKARDRGDVEALRTAIASAQSDASRTGSFDAYLRTAVFDDWLFEAANDRQDKKLANRAAQAGLAAAEKAVQLNPNSSEAHRLLGAFLGELIPYAFAGGLRYGPRSTREIDQAIELDSKNANAYVSRATNYLFTPQTFGGDKSKAVELLKHAIEIDPLSDTAHLWLAQVYLALGRGDDALREVNEAKRLNPERALAQHVAAQINSKKQY